MKDLRLIGIPSRSRRTFKDFREHFDNHYPDDPNGCTCGSMYVRGEFVNERS